MFPKLFLCNVCKIFKPDKEKENIKETRSSDFQQIPKIIANKFESWLGGFLLSCDFFYEIAANLRFKEVKTFKLKRYIEELKPFFMKRKYVKFSNKFLNKTNHLFKHSFNNNHSL